MGAPVVLDVAVKMKYKNLLGVVIIDVVEGTAVDAIKFM